MNFLTTIIESILFSALFCGIYWTIGFFCKSTFGFEIRSDRGYTIAIISGIAFKIILVKILENQY